MLTKNEFEAMQQQLTERNCTYEEKDPREFRKGATGTVHGQNKLAQAVAEDSPA